MEEVRPNEEKTEKVRTLLMIVSGGLILIGLVIFFLAFMREDPVTEKLRASIAASKAPVVTRGEVTSRIPVSVAPLPIELPHHDQVPDDERKAETAEKGAETSEKEKEPLSFPWAVQVFSGKSYQEAKRILDKIREEGYPAYVINLKLNDETWYRLRIGSYLSKEEAEKVGQEVVTAFHLKGFWVMQPSDGERKTPLS